MSRRVANVRGTNLAVSFDENLNSVVIYRRDGDGEHGATIDLDLGEWAALADQARRLRAVALPEGHPGISQSDSPK